MSDAIWYYLDSNRESIGPVGAELVRAARRAGKIDDSSLVWRDGMPEWIPLERVLDELGLAPELALAEPVGPPPMYAAPPADSSLYRPPSAPLIDDRSVAGGEVVPAGFMRRWVALFLDSLILGIPLIVISFLIAIPIGLFGDNADAAGALVQGMYYLMYIVVAPLYYAGMESSQHQATLGKQAMGIKVTDDQGRRLSFAHALGRWFAAGLSYATFYIGFLMAAFTERKRALHDIVANTLVVDRWAYTEFPERQKRGLSGCLIAFLVVMLLVPVMAIILAAIAIPSYQDYVKRAQQSGASR